MASIADVAKQLNNKDYSPNIIDIPQGDIVAPNEDVVYPRDTIGYVQGYAEYNKRIGKTKKSANEITFDERIKTIKDPQMIDNHTNIFRNDLTNDSNKEINKFSTDSYEDPTYLTFDVTILKNDSNLPLFDNVNSFMKEYADVVPEIKERLDIFTQFTARLAEIFPIEGEESGSKRHYIESIAGLELLTKQIVEYPTDVITITLTEDVSMTLQYLSELYNNLVYSYDTHRYLIPDNLLRFNMRITIRDVRNMKIPRYDGISSKLNDYVSKFIYVLHDCQFEFLETKNFGSDIKRGGFGASAIPLSAGGVVKMNYKSISKITAPILKTDSKVIDFRERETIVESDPREFYKNGRDFFSDGKTDLEYQDLMKKNAKKENKFATLINQEISDVRNVIINQIKEEASQLITKGQRWIGDHLGFTIGKVNVYYNTLTEKVENVSFMLESFLDKKADDLMGRSPEKITTKIGNIYTPINPLLLEERENAIQMDKGEVTNRNPYKIGPNHNTTPTKPDETIDLSTHTGPSAPKELIDLSSTPHPDKPLGIVDLSSHTGPSAPKELIDLSSTPHPDETSPRIYPDGTYNEKYPSGDLHPDGKYNEKYPKGDLLPDGKYNEKYPSGDLHPDGTYNQKFPSGDKLSDGTYNEKYPDGDLNPDGVYNEKYPKGNIYNVKYKSLPPNKDLGNLYKNNNQ